MRAGNLAPDDIMCGIVRERLRQPDCRFGVILDGFPRTIEQALFLDDFLEKCGSWKPVVFHISIDQGLLVKRAVGRRVCSVFG
jgi:adenylate kinase